MQNAFLSHADAALRNRNNILRFVKEHTPISRTDIWENVNVSRASVTQIIRQLQDSGLILETGEGESTGGRKPKFLIFHGAARKYYAFDWSERCLYLMDLDGTVLYEKQLCFPTPVLPVEFAAEIKAAVAQIDSLQLCPEEEVVGFGLSLPGQIDSRTGTVLRSVELGWQSISLRELFADRFGGNVYLERTGNMMALGEKTDGSNHFQLYILGSDGIGVSTVIRGGCQHGANYMHGELGHIKMPEDTLCSCGQRGCLEAVVRRLLQQSGGEITEQVMEYLAMGVSASVNISDTDSILLVGSFVEQMNRTQRNELKQKIREKVTSQHMRKLQIRFSDSGKELTKKGFCVYLFDRTFPVD